MALLQRLLSGWKMDWVTLALLALWSYTGANCEIEVNECNTSAGNPCLNGGVCQDQLNYFNCSCPAGFAGPRCEVGVNGCNSGPCLNGAICNDAIDGYTCDCKKGYSGANCQVNRDDCQGISCNKGTCVDGLDSFTCHCYHGYTGQRCDTPINECASKPCRYGGSCLDLDNKYECKCLPGTWGSNCENNVDDCVSNPCRSGASCVDGINNYSCVCRPGFTGSHCQIDIDDCEPNPCHNKGRCIDLENGFRCSCLPGFYGSTCQSDVDECAPRPCLNGGRCVDRNNRFECECPQGLTGLRCESDINECNSNPCQHGGTCQNNLNNYTCSCKSGYTGINCEEDIQDCASNPCLHGICIDQVNNYTCRCDPHFTGRNCDISKRNPCSSNPCRNMARCDPRYSHQETTYRCNCLTGFTGKYCEKDINECTSSYHPCKNGGTCQNTYGSYMCECADGYTGGRCDTNVDDCQPNPCSNGGTCIDGLASYTCDCVRGFTGRRCETDINECEPNPCVNEASCHDYLSFYMCTCLPGFSGINCQVNDNDCTHSSCLHNGTCIDKVNGYQCQCINGYTGSNCHISPKSCDSNPCLNGATCLNQDGGYQCSCPYGFSGTRCETLLDWCSQEPCQNGAACEQDTNRFLCKCSIGWTGKLCDIPMVSCELAAKQKGLFLSELCKNEGICQNIGNSSHKCTCHKGYDGSYCEVEVDECSSSPCLNGASCEDSIGTYTCQCAQGFQGQNCELNIDSCALKPCKNGGTCHNFDDSFVCSCPPGTALPLCEDNRDDCLFNVCHNGGTCVDQVGGYMCICPIGFVGRQCEGNVNRCLSNPCDAKGTQDCVQVSNNFRCECKDGWTGQSCNTLQQCDQGPCQNGGQCRDSDNGVVCTCKQGFVGEFCQKTISDCDPNPCKNQGTCSVTATGYKCVCPDGVRGRNCETVFRDNCNGIVCQNGGTCLNRAGFFECLCPKNWRHRYCQVYDVNSPGGIGFNDTHAGGSVPEVCQKYDCPQKGENGVCDKECNLNECNYDNTDCSYGTKPWKNCTTKVNGQYCWQVFKDGKCDQECNSQNCLFDGFDCQEPVRSCQFEKYCQANLNNGHCDQGCNNLECDWDGFDCDNDKRQHVPGSLFVIFLVEPAIFRDKKSQFLHELGLVLHAVVRIKKSATGEEMIYPWAGYEVDNNVPLLRHTRQLAEPLFDSHHKRSTISGTKVFLEIETRACNQLKNEGCFSSADRVAEFVVADLLNSRYRTAMAIHQIGTETSTDSPADKSSSSDLFTMFGVVCATVLTLTLVVIVVMKRKRVQGITWFPQGFFNRLSEQEKPARNRKRPEGQEMQEKFTRTDATGDSNTSCLVSEFWKEEDDEDMPQRKKTKMEGQELIADSPDQQHWTNKCFNAENVRHSMSAQTPPQGEESLQTVADINVPGPDGLTALMLAVIRGCGLGDDEECPLVSGSSEGGGPDNNPSVDTISSLLMQGASISDKTDQTGETCLHLAARYAKAHAAKILLDAGADPNAEDNTGRTPLHTAVAASADEVFQILLRNRFTNLNARMLCGTTPLMLACKLAIEDTVAELLAADADIEATDNNGRTALHWAAAVNNTDAVTLLLKNNANTDAQNTKEETPLFLAAREGSYKAAEILLSHYANRDTTDNMDRLPRDVALERCHSDIVELLDTYRVPTPAGIHLSEVTPGNYYHGNTASVQATKPKTKNRKSKTAAAVVSPQGSIIVAPATSRQAKTRKKKWDEENKANAQQLLEQHKQISSSFSPNNYLQPSHPSSSGTSPMSTISTGNYSVDSYSSPHHFEMSPLRFENPHLIPPSRLEGDSLELDDFQTNSSFTPLLKHTDLENLLTEWVSLQSKLQRRQEQLEFQQQHFYNNGGEDISNSLNGSSPNSQIEIVDNLNDTTTRPVVQALPHSKNITTSPTHIQANQQHGYQLNAHRIPRQHIHDFQTALRAEQLPVSLINEQISSTNRQNRLLQTQQWQQDAQQHKQQYLTPPSHGGHITDSPLHHHNTLNSLQPDHFLTPSPDSPSHWSSSSPHSAYSDWSDRISSPVSSIIGLRPQQNKFLTEHAYL